MSRSEKEYGVIKFTQAGINAVSKEIKAITSKRNEELFSFAMSIYTFLSGVKGTKERLRLFGTIPHKNDGSIEMSPLGPGNVSPKRLSDLGGIQYLSYPLGHCEHYTLKEELFRSKTGGLCKPRKSAFANPKSANVMEYFDDELQIIINKEMRTMVWDVSYNNHSIDQAENSYLGHYVLSFLQKKYKWRKSEGGRCYAQNEYNEPSGGLSFTSASRVFGPKGKRDEDSELERYCKSIR